ncbi:MAG: hypothetical protein ACRD3Q_07405 [Terriglobales bacterium]
MQPSIIRTLTSARFGPANIDGAARLHDRLMQGEGTRTQTDLAG